MKEKPLCGYCYNECADDCCDKRRIDVLERQLIKLQEAYDFNLELLSEKERQLAEAREEIESYKYDLETLVSVVTDCLNKMSSEECYDTLQQVANHYKQLKEKG